MTQQFYSLIVLPEKHLTCTPVFIVALLWQPQIGKNKNNYKCLLTKEWRNNFLYSYNEILLNNKNEPVTDICNHMSEFQNHYVEWSLYTRGHPAWLYLYKVLDREN